MDLSRKLFFVLAIPLLIQVTTLIMLSRLESEAEASALKSDEARNLAIVIKNFESSTVVILRTHTNQEELAADCADPTLAESQWNRMRTDMSELEKLSAGDEVVRKGIQSIRRRMDDLIHGYNWLKDNWRKTNKYGFEQRRPVWRRLGLISKSLWRDTAELSRHELNIVESVTTEQSTFRKRTQSVLLAAGIGAVLSTLTIALILMRTVVNRMSILRDNARRLSQNKPLHKPISGSDEIAIFDSTFHSMAKSLREAALRERAIVDNAQDMICALDEQLVFLSVNSAAAALVGVEPQLILHRLLVEFLETMDVARSLARFEKLRTEAGAPGQFELQLNHLDGRKIDSLWSATWSEEDRRFYCVAHNITERRRAERLREESISMLNHDLRSPLTSLQLTFDSLNSAEVVRNDDELGPLVKRGHQNCDRLLQMTKNLLDLDRFSAEVVKLNAVRCDVAQIAMAAFEAVERLAATKHISLHCELPTIFVLGDGSMLERVMTNLLTNAIKFAPEASAIEVSAHRLDGLAEVCIEDEGPGIPPDKVDMIFERYRQVDEHRKIFEGGSGLGLAICRSIIQLHGGTIRVERRVEKGSRFIFTIPLSDDHVVGNTEKA